MIEDILNDWKWSIPKKCFHIRSSTVLSLIDSKNENILSELRKTMKVKRANSDTLKSWANDYAIYVKDPMSNKDKKMLLKIFRNYDLS